MRAQQLYIFATIVATCLLAAVTLLAVNRVHRDNDAAFARSLDTALSATHEAVRVWSADNQNRVSNWADSAEVRRFTADLLETDPNRKALAESPAQRALRNGLRPVHAGKGYYGFFIIGRDLTNLASSRDDNLGLRNLLAGQEAYFNRIWNGQTAMSTPLSSDVPLPDVDGTLVEGLPTMFVGAPVRNAAGEVVAALAFRIDPARDFSALLRTAWNGETGETFAFDSQGRLISESRFENRLKDLGLLAQGDRAILNVGIREPVLVKDRRGNYRASGRQGELTYMAEHALAGQSGINPEGYISYAGRRVIGAWQWVPDLGLGLAAEIAEDEMHGPFGRVTAIIVSFAVFSLALFLGLGALFVRARKRTEESERHYRDLVDGSLQGMCIHQDGRIVYANRTYAVMHGYDLDEIMGCDIERMVFAGDLQMLRERRAARTAKENGIDRYGTRGLRKDGSIVWLEALVRTVEWRGGLATQATLVDTTQRVLAERRQQESEQRFRDFAESASDWLWEMGPDLRFTSLSQRFFERFDIRTGDLIGKTHEELVFLAGGDHWAAHLDDLANRRPFRDVRYTLELSGGTRREHSVSGMPIHAPDGAFLGYRGTARDITEEVAARKVVERMEAHLRDAVTAIADGFGYYDAERRLVFCNEQYRKPFVGMEHLLIPGARFDDIAREAAERGLITQAKGRVGEWVENRINRYHEAGGLAEQELSDGRWVQVSEHRTQEGGMVAVRTDITELKRREVALRRSKQLLGNAERIAHLGSWQLDLRTDTLNWSEETYNICGVDEQTFKPKLNNLMALVHPDDREMVETAWASAIEQGGGYSLNHRIVRPDGGICTVHNEAEHEYDDEGQPVLLSGVIQDITHRTLLEERVRESDKLGALGQMAGGVAHDFNNILMVIDGYTKRALSSREDSGMVGSALGEVVTAADKAKGLTRQLLVFGRRQPLETKVVRAGAVVEALDTLLRPLLGETIELSVEAPDGEICVEVDEPQLTQALINLAINGRDAMPRGGRLSVALEADELRPEDLRHHPEAAQGIYARFTVSDNGEGMEAETAARIFEPFFTTKEQGKGTGLGLAMVYGFIQQSGGLIDVRSEPGAGTTFTVQLPVVEKVPTIQVFETTGDVAAKGETILLAEDDDALRRLAQTMLEELGYEVLAATDGFDALELEADYEGPIHLLLSDVVMPSLGGIELACAMRETRPDTRLLLMSGYPARGDTRSIELPADVPLMQKPIDPETLARVIRDTLDLETEAAA